nr:glycosyltransferase [Conyzicola lurida]
MAGTDFVLIANADGKFSAGETRVLVEARPVESDVVYTDEYIFGVKPTRFRFKPDSSPERLRCQFYWGNAVFYRRELLQRLGGVRTGIPGAELYDLALRAQRSGAVIEHFRATVFALPDGTPPVGAVSGQAALDATRTVLEEHLAETGGGYVESVHENGAHRTHRSVVGDPLVSIVIPTRGSLGEVHGETRCLVIEAVRTIIEKTTYENYELVVVMDSVADPAVTQTLRDIGGDRMRIVWWDRPFNFSAKMNLGVFHARGEYVLFLNDDTEVITPGWIEPMLSLCQRPGAGMAGAMLYFEDDSIQHAGHIYERGDAGHIGTVGRRGASGPLNSFLVEREISGVTAACSMMPRDVFDEVGGFSLLLPGNFNDVDLCMKVTELGHTIYWTPNTELYHYESKTRVSRVARYEVETAWGRWEWRLDDPTYWPYGSMLTSDENASL